MERKKKTTPMEQEDSKEIGTSVQGESEEVTTEVNASVQGEGEEVNASSENTSVRGEGEEVTASENALVIESKADGNPFNMEVKKPQKSKPSGAGAIVKRVLNHIFIDGLSGMAIGLFATLIIGTIIAQIGSFIPGAVGRFLGYIGTFAKAMMGAGIGVGMAYKLKKSPLVSISAGVAGMVGAFASNIISGNTAIVGVGEPLGAFVAAFVALEVGSLVSGKTKVDILVTPLVSVISGSAIGLLVGPPISAFMLFLGGVINASARQQPIIMGILVAVLMGMALTLPISSAAIGISLALDGIAAGAAVVGCCCQMVGFAVMSFRENRWSGLVAQGVGTSMLQMPNIIRRPVVWVPPIVASAILGPISSAAFKMTSNAVGSGMGTAGLVGNFSTFVTMTEAGVNAGIVLAEIALMHFVLPALICLGICELFRHFKVVKMGDLKLDL